MHPFRTAAELSRWAAQHDDCAVALFGERELSGYDRMARSLSLDADGYYAECWLGRRRRLDLLFAFERDGRRLASVLDSVARGKVGEQSPAWRVARDLVAKWPELRDRITTVWFEFDDVVAGSLEHGPSLSMCMVPEYDEGYRPARDASPGDDAEASLAVYRASAADLRDAEIEERLLAAGRALPPGGKLIHLSIMAAREPRATKVYGVIPRHRFRAYLEAIAWRGPMDVVGHVLHRLATPKLCGDDNIYFDLNLSNMRDAGRATLGIAFSQQQVVADPKNDASRRPLLDRLVREEQCLGPQAEALSRWATPKGDGASVSGISRWLDVKTVIGPGTALESKAYLGFSPRPHPFLALAG